MSESDEDLMKTTQIEVGDFAKEAAVMIAIESWCDEHGFENAVVRPDWPDNWEGKVDFVTYQRDYEYVFCVCYTLEESIDGSAIYSLLIVLGYKGGTIVELTKPFFINKDFYTIL